jgi:hypothetical protein
MRKPTEPNTSEELRLKRLISARGLASRYGIHLRSISRWIARGVIPPPDQIICDRRYWYVETLDAADRARTVAAGTKRAKGQDDQPANSPAPS